jgi:taste receptor type 2
MKFHGKGSQDPSTKIHMKALKTVVSFLFLFAMYSFSVILSGWSFNKLMNNAVHLIFQAAGTIYPSSHSCTLIWGNKKLKQAFLSVLGQTSYGLKNGNFQVHRSKTGT